MNIVEILENQINQRLILEGIDRIRTCLTYLSHDDIWFALNTNVTTIGSLILHLDGNVRQWLLVTLIDLDYIRQRDDEFAPAVKHKKTDLLNILSALQSDIEKISLTNVNLTQEVNIQGFQETVLGVIIHVIEHFSYHVGQITTLTKIAKNVNTAYYEDLDLNII